MRREPMLISAKISCLRFVVAAACLIPMTANAQFSVHNAPGTFEGVDG